MSRKSQERYRQAGLCIFCGVTPRPGRQTCEACASRCRQNAKRTRDRWLANHQCCCCGSVNLATKRHCQECARKHYALTRSRYAKIRDEVFLAYGGYRCTCCGEEEIAFLTIDHVNGGGTKHRKEIGNSSTYRWLKKNGYPPGFQVLCMNCQWGRKNCNGVCPHQRNKMSKIIDFYLQDGTDSEGRTLEEVLNWSNHAWESAHDSIQTMFPLKDPSNFNPEAPLLTEEDIAKWNEESMDGAVLRNNLAFSFARFMRFLGLEYKDTEVKIAEDFPERQKTVWDGFNHNWLRITRCLASLRMLGLQQEADAFYKRLQALYESKRFPINDKTFKFWTEAVTGQPFTSTLGG